MHSVRAKVLLLVMLPFFTGLVAPATAVEVTQLAYGPASAHVLDLYTPDESPAGSIPTVVLAHGGLWQSGGRSSLATLCSNIVSRSEDTIACASIDYRLSQDLGGSCTGTGTDTYVDQTNDMALAYALLQSEADTHGLDPQRMHVGGHSAGAHLAHNFNLRWAEFARPCTHPGGCPTALGAIGFEGIYDIPAWNAYDASFWGGSFACATRKAFGAPGPSPTACLDAQLGERCWDAGSPIYLAQNTVALGTVPVGDALLIHSPGDNWVDIAEATSFGASLSAAFPEIDVVTNTDGTCATGQHNDPLTQTALADCIIDFVAARFPAATPVPMLSNGAIAVAAGVLLLSAAVALSRIRRQSGHP